MSAIINPSLGKSNNYDFIMWWYAAINQFISLGALDLFALSRGCQECQIRHVLLYMIISRVHKLYLLC